MIKVENENVEVRGIALDVIGEFQALCDHLNKELGEKDFAFVLGTIAGKFYKKRIAELEDDLNNASQVCAICQKEQENDRLKADIAYLEKQLAEKDKRIKKLNLEAQKYYEDAYCNDFQDKAKADFAIGQLEQLKYNIRLDNSDEETGDMPYVLDTNCLFEQIDNKIHELRGQK